MGDRTYSSVSLRSDGTYTQNGYTEEAVSYCARDRDQDGNAKWSQQCFSEAGVVRGDGIIWGGSAEKGQSLPYGSQSLPKREKASKDIIKASGLFMHAHLYTSSC